MSSSKFSPEEVVVIEDSPVGITAAKTAELTLYGMATMMDHFDTYPDVVFLKDFFAIAKQLKEREAFPCSSDRGKEG